jgi:hypothetical protein
MDRKHTYEAGDLLGHNTQTETSYFLLVLEALPDPYESHNIVYRVLDPTNDRIYLENQLFVDENFKRIA